VARTCATKDRSASEDASLLELSNSITPFVDRFAQGEHRDREQPDNRGSGIGPEGQDEPRPGRIERAEDESPTELAAGGSLGIVRDKVVMAPDSVASWTAELFPTGS
jgi:hypothetical protein